MSESMSPDLCRALFEESSDGLLIADDEGRYRAANERSSELTGYSHAELTGMTEGDLLATEGTEREPTDTLPESRAGIRKRTIRRKDGVLRTVEISSRTLTDGSRLDILRDILELTQAKELLEQREERYRSLVESALDPMFTSDANGTYLYVNTAAAAMLGRRPEDIIGKTVDELFPPDVARKYRAGVSYVIRTGETLIAEERSSINGRTMWFSSVVQPVRDRHGRVYAAQAVVRDITKLKQAEQALRESEERLRQAIAVAHIGMFDHDHLTDTLFWSPQQREIFGVGLDEPLSVKDLGPTDSNGTPLYDPIYPRDRERIAPAVRRAHDPAGDGMYEAEHRIVRRDGAIRWITVRAQTFFEGEGDKRRPVRTIGAVRDVTSLKEAEQALRENEERLRQAVRLTNIGIFDHDHTTDSIFWSPEQRAIYGYTPEESVSGRDLLPVEGGLPAYLAPVCPPDRERIAAAVMRAHDPAGDGSYDVEHRIVRHDGTVRWVITRSQTFFDGEGDQRRPVRTVGAVRDITADKLAEAEREKLQAQLIQAQKMESIGRLAGGVAHDFNNMLNVIQGYAELGLTQLEPSSALHAALEEVQKAARRSADLTQQLLAFARRQKVTPKVLDLNDVVSASLKMLRRLIGEHINQVWVPGHRLWSVRMDSAQVDQVLANLAANARDAIAGVGEIVIRTENVEIDEARAGLNGALPGEYVMLEVRDDGPGMDQETQAHIFEPFYTTKAEGQGTGLGLATVYGIVRQNNGFINVDSEMGKGTTVQIFLPRFEGRPVEPSPGEPTVPKTGSETVLLVEDEPMVLRLSRTLLEQLGYTVLVAATPGDAVRQAAEHADKIQLLITDVVMPEMNGPDLARRLLSRYPHIKCLFVSGYSAGTITPMGELGEDVHFLQKPFRLGDLAAKVRETLERA